MTNAQKPITALLPYFGAKRNLAPLIVEELGKHIAYWEPFCGSMAVLLAKKPAAVETVNDLNGDAINLAMVIAANRAPELYGRLKRTLYCDGIYDESDKQLAATDPTPPESIHHVRGVHVERAYWYFVSSWMGRNGLTGAANKGQGMSVRYTNNGGTPGVRFTQAVNSIPAWHSRLSHVWICRRNAFEMIGKIDDEARTAIYCDPPYIEKGARYIHDFERADHQRLADALRRFKRARVVVSYYEHADLAGLYPGWTKRSINVPKSLANVVKREKNNATATEVLVINGPSYATHQQNQLFADEGVPA